MEPSFFETPDGFRAWFEAHAEDAFELWVGFYKKGSGRPSITWPEAVDQALCFGWIDGIRKSIDEASYKIRFTPRRPGSIWSTVNIGRVAELSRLGLMRPAGLRAFAARDEQKSAIYSHEQRQSVTLDPEAEREFRANEPAWAFFQSQPPSYRKALIWWVASAKRPETHQKRLATLIEESARGQTIAQFRRPGKPTE
jgi:uncharacterized protein YdeI (YjbR/CyaY-like superfamily)